MTPMDKLPESPPQEWLRDSTGVGASPERWVQLAEERGAEMMALSRRCRILRDALDTVLVTTQFIKSDAAVRQRVRNTAERALKNATAVKVLRDAPQRDEGRDPDLFTERLFRQGVEMMKEIGRDPEAPS